jgi:hypothetical protein
MKKPNAEDQASGLILGSEPIDGIRDRRAYKAAADDDKRDVGDSGDDDATDSDSDLIDKGDTDKRDTDLTDKKD